MTETRSEPILLGPLLQNFFSHHLLSHRRASPQTVASYRDAFRLLLRFLQDSQGKSPSSLRVTDMDAPVILTFLDHIEHQRHNAVRSRNARLAAIRSFFRLVSLREPSLISVATRVLAIPVKRTPKRIIGHLTQAEIRAILAVPDQKQWSGQRDYALLLTMYNTGARVSEIVSLRRQQVHLGESTFLDLHGKGRKQRSIPLWTRTARCLKQWLEKLPAAPAAPLFPNFRGEPLSRDGADYILKKSIEQAKTECPSLSAKNVSPHVLRHTTAMHLLQSGVEMSVIALWLGHESLETTHMYVEADMKTKQQALEKLPPLGTGPQRFRPNDKLLAFLETL